MEKKFKLGIIGAGFMSSAIVSGIISSKILKENEIIVSDISNDNLEKIKQKGVFVSSENLFVCNNSDFVLFAVKPQNICVVLDSIKNASCKKFISIMAGVKKAKIKEVFPSSLVARCMPNTPCSIGYGAVGIDISDYSGKEDIAFIESIFTSFAHIEFVSEDLIDTVTGISGSSPAYFYMFIKGIIDSGIKNGLTYNQAKNLAVSTMIGSGKMLERNDDKTIDELINAVCSKGGTTIEAVKVFNDNKLFEIIDKSVDACIKRAKELEELS